MGRCKLYISLILLLLITFFAKENTSKEVLAMVTSQQEPNVVSDSSFVVFDGTGYREKPDLTKFGLEPIHIIYPPRLFKKSTHELKGTAHLPFDKLLRKQAEKARQENEIAVIDIEHWPVKGPEKEVDQSIDRYLKVLESFRELTPGMKYGYYGMPPVPDYWNAIQDSTSTRYKKWEGQNQRLNQLADKVDAFFPSLYTYYQDRERWVRYAIANIRQARKYNGEKPVYVFLWPQYHGYNKKLKGQFIDPEFWRIQLQTARKYADGIVLWTPSRLKWDSNAEWWEITKEFVQKWNGNHAPEKASK